jgi:hypothetical protein
MADHTDRLAEHRRLDSHTKTSSVLAAINAATSAGQALSIAALARKANVSRRFIYDHPELRAQAERAAAQAADHHGRTGTTSSQVTTASLRADLANAKAANHRLSTELAALRRRLGQQLGHDVLADLDWPTIEASTTTTERLTQLEQSLFQATEELATRTQELEAARQINRELIGRLNREQH